MRVVVCSVRACWFVKENNFSARVRPRKFRGGDFRAEKNFGTEEVQAGVAHQVARSDSISFCSFSSLRSRPHLSASPSEMADTETVHMHDAPSAADKALEEKTEEEGMMWWWTDWRRFLAEEEEEGRGGAMGSYKTSD